MILSGLEVETDWAIELITTFVTVLTNNDCCAVIKSNGND